MRKADPSPRADAERTPSRLRANPERTQSEPLVDPKRTQIFEKRTRSGPKANPGSTFWVRFGVRLGPVGTVAICINVATVGIRFYKKNTIFLFHSLWFLCPNPPILAAISYSNTTCLIFKMITFNPFQQMFTRGAISFQAKQLFMIGKRIYITLSKSIRSIKNSPLKHFKKNETCLVKFFASSFKLCTISVD